MEQTRITIDAHTLVWALDEKLNDKLSQDARQAILRAEKYGTIYVPTIALLEVLRLAEKGKIALPFDILLSKLEKSKHHEVIPFDTKLLKVAMPIQGLELHDRVILATALMTESDLVSKDRVIKANSYGANVIW